MEKEKVAEWLSAMAEAVKTLSKYGQFICEVNIKENSLQLHNTARMFAESLGLELQETPWKTADSTATYISFQYKGVTFFELENLVAKNEDVQ